MKYNRTFNLNPSDIDVIETCLRKELFNRSTNFQGAAQRKDAEKTEKFKHDISEITELLGKIHSQKIWFNDDPAVPKG